MREILFRGKRRDNGEWIEGSLLKVTFAGETIYLIFADKYGFDGNGIKALDHSLVATDSIGEFTGLTDRNGKRIFEGDILIVKTIRESVAKETRNDEYTAYGVVVFNKGHFELEGKGLVLCTYWGLKSLYTAASFKEYEIIGNIHDNPERLEVE